MIASRLAVVAFVALGTVACGDDGHSHGEEQQFICDGTENSYDPGEQVAGTAFKMEIVEANPVPHTVQINTLRVKVMDMQDVPQDSVEFMSIEPFTNKHDHGTPITPEVAAVGTDGMYDITNINYVHRGPWRLDMEIRAGGTSDFLQYIFCIRDPGFEDAGPAE